MEYRHYYLGRELVKQGMDVTVVSASYSHLFHRLPESGQKIMDGVRFRWVKVPRYKDSHSKKRVLKWFVYFLQLFLLPFSRLPRPDVIVVSPMAPFPVLPGYVLAKYFQAKLVYEVKDIWPLTLIELGGYSPSHPFIRFMGWFERFALKKSDLVVSNLGNYGAHMQHSGISRNFLWISNGIDMVDISEAEPLDLEIAEMIPSDKFVVGYAGTVGIANALDCFLAARDLIANKDMVFVVVGDGKEKERLMSACGHEGILFLPAIPKKQVPGLLSMFDVCYIGWQKQKLYDYGVSANKLFEYMYSGKPIIHAISSPKDLVSLAGCGLVVAAGDPAAVAKAVETLYTMPAAQREQMGAKGREYVVKHFTYEALAKRFMAGL